MQTAAVEKIQPRRDIEPFSMSIEDAGAYFGLAPKTIRNWTYNGRLQYGKHYCKCGRKVLIIVKEMKALIIEGGV